MTDAFDSFITFEGTPTTRATTYCHRHHIRIVDDRAGLGNDGALFKSSSQSILKAFDRPATYSKEKSAYERLMRHRVMLIHGHHVPQLLGCDDAMGVLELSIVSRPFVLDFGKIRLDQPLEDYWPDDILAERWAYWRSLFSDEQRPTVIAIFRALGKQYGIWLEDIHPGNIGFVDE